MKLNLIRTICIMSIAIVFYASCKKESKPASSTTTKTTIDYKAMSSQIALSLYKGITGQYGGTDVTKGIKLPSNIAVNNRPGLSINSLNSLCGFVVDTTFNTVTKVGDNTNTLSGNFHFVYTCSNTTPDGYTVHDSLTSTGSNYKYVVGQDYVVKALDQTYKVVSMNGNIYTSAFTSAGGGFTQLGSLYQLKNLVVNSSSGSADITSGIATFQTFGYQQSSQPFDDGHPFGEDRGTITYIGNHMATLTLTSQPGVTFLVNLQTGAVTQK